MGVDRSPMANVQREMQFIIGDKFAAKSGESIQQGSVVETTGSLVGPYKKHEVKESRTNNSSKMIGVAFHKIKASASKEDVDYLQREVGVIVFGPAKVRNGSGAISIGDPVTSCQTQTDGNAVEHRGLIKKASSGDHILGFALDNFAAFDNVGDVGEIFVNPRRVA